MPTYLFVKRPKKAPASGAKPTWTPFRYHFSPKLEPMLKESRDVVARLLD